MKKCKKCGFMIGDTAKFCTNCGSKIEIETIKNLEPTVSVPYQGQGIQISTPQIAGINVVHNQNNMMGYNQNPKNFW